MEILNSIQKGWFLLIKLAGLVPKSTLTLLPAPRFSPIMVTLVPPDSGPRLGDNPVTDGICKDRKRRWVGNKQEMETKQHLAQVQDVVFFFVVFFECQIIFHSNCAAQYWVLYITIIKFLLTYTTKSLGLVKCLKNKFDLHLFDQKYSTKLIYTNIVKYCYNFLFQYIL